MKNYTYAFTCGLLLFLSLIFLRFLYIYMDSCTHSRLLSYLFHYLERLQFIHPSDFGLWVLIFTCLISNDMGFLAIYLWSKVSSLLRVCSVFCLFFS